MSASLCPREPELLDALTRGFVDSELQVHAIECADCGELQLVAGALLDDKAHAVAEAPLRAAGTMWWRIRIRERQEAEGRAQRSLVLGQALTLAFAVVLIGALFGTEIVAGVRTLATHIKLSTPILLALATWLLVAPIAGWVAIRQK